MKPYRTLDEARAGFETFMELVDGIDCAAVDYRELLAEFREEIAVRIQASRETSGAEDSE